MNGACHLICGCNLARRYSTKRYLSLSPLACQYGVNSTVRYAPVRGPWDTSIAARSRTDHRTDRLSKALWPVEEEALLLLLTHRPRHGQLQHSGCSGHSSTSHQSLHLTYTDSVPTSLRTFIMSVTATIAKLEEWRKGRSRYFSEVSRLLPQVRSSDATDRHRFLKEYALLYAELEMLECCGEEVVGEMNQALRVEGLDRSSLPTEIQEAMKSITNDKFRRSNPQWDELEELLDDTVVQARQASHPGCTGGTSPLTRSF